MSRNPTSETNITFFNGINENKQKTTYERRSLHDWRGRDSGCPVAKTYCFILLLYYSSAVAATIQLFRGDPISWDEDYE
jgi:hypothetical protein